MNPREMTLEQMQEREANRIAFQKAKAEKAIAKLAKRAEECSDEKEIERLNNVIATHQSFKGELEKADVAKLSLTKFNKIKEKLSGGKIKPTEIVEDLGMKEEPLIGK